MRGLFTPIPKVRRQVFTEIASHAYHRDLVQTDFSYFYESSYRIIPGEVAHYRDSVFKERAIIRERIRLALGLPLRPADIHQSFTDGMADVAVAGKRLTAPLVNVIPFACEACPTDHFKVTDNCRKCLAHPCTSVCPVNAVTIGKTRAIIDHDKCIRCGRCQAICPYHAIVRTGRPCAESCGANAIDSDELGRATINQEKCVACGMCIVSCPFAAISDKSELYQVITAIRLGYKVHAAIAPAFVGQFGPLATPGKVVSGLLALGFADVIEVGIGADIGTVMEAEEFLEKVPEAHEFLGTSCCPAWESFARQSQPQLASCISSASTPMKATAHAIKGSEPDSIVVFIGPCIAKKLEALEPEVAPFVDFVLTFEELMGMFTAKEIDLVGLAEQPFRSIASRDGRGYAVSGGVASAIKNTIAELDPAREVPILKADSLAECKKLLALAKAGKAKGHLIEGMACPSGCVGGPGTLMPIARAGQAVSKFAQESPFGTALDNDTVLPER